MAVTSYAFGRTFIHDSPHYFNIIGLPPVFDSLATRLKLPGRGSSYIFTLPGCCVHASLGEYEVGSAVCGSTFPQLRRPSSSRGKIIRNKVIRKHVPDRFSAVSYRLVARGHYVAKS